MDIDKASSGGCGMKLARIVALVPMRHHSQRVPGKNFRLLAGKPLFHYILETLTNCLEVAQIVVDTNSPEVMTGIRSDFPRVQVLERPEHLRSDDIPMNEILMYDTSQIEADLFLQTHSTNPLLRSETVTLAIQRLRETFPSKDSLFGVTRLQTRLWDQYGRAVNHDPNVLLQTQDLPPIYEENSCLYLFTARKPDGTA